MIFEINVEVVRLVSVLLGEIGDEVNRTVTLPIAIMISAPQTITVSIADTALRAFTSLKSKVTGLGVSAH